jgi:hypothetical protein
MEFKLGEESRYIVPSHEFSSSQEFVDKNGETLLL